MSFRFETAKEVEEFKEFVEHQLKPNLSITNSKNDGAGAIYLTIEKINLRENK
jgi:hypothetical protein